MALVHFFWDCPAQKPFTPSQRKWECLIWEAFLEHCASLDLVRELIFGIYYIVGFMYPSLHLISGSQRAKICSCSSLHPCTAHRAWYRASFQLMLLLFLEMPLGEGSDDKRGGGEEVKEGGRAAYRH